MSMVKAGQKSVKKSVKERSNGHSCIILGYSLVSKDSHIMPPLPFCKD